MVLSLLCSLLYICLIVTTDNLYTDPFVIKFRYESHLKNHYITVFLLCLQFHFLAIYPSKSFMYLDFRRLIFNIITFNLSHVNFFSKYVPL